MKFKIFCTFILLLFILGSCNNKQSDTLDSNLSSIEGMIADKANNNQSLLVIPNINKSDITNKDLNDLLNLAEQNNGIYFIVSNEEYEIYNIGDKVIVEYDLEGDVEESNPPIRSAVNIKSLN
uniref:DUF3221 domain-containing protein n=1 Tax=uncultured Allobacillus sp. TaxID=1638025 RepID=UPI0025939896|nr:DUF3221 domain-containing protein [uncultured Allobacillus sp.]